jgi:hypothetical protein
MGELDRIIQSLGCRACWIAAVWREGWTREGIPTSWLAPAAGQGSHVPVTGWPHNVNVARLGVFGCEQVRYSRSARLERVRLNWPRLVRRNSNHSRVFSLPISIDQLCSNWFAWCYVSDGA